MQHPSRLSTGPPPSPPPLLPPACFPSSTAAGMEARAPQRSNQKVIAPSPSAYLFNGRNALYEDALVWKGHRTDILWRTPRFRGI